LTENWWEEDKLASEENNWWEEDDLADSETLEKEPSIGELIEYGFDKGEADYQKWAAGALASIDDPVLRNIMGGERGISLEGFYSKSGKEVYGEEFVSNIDRDRRIELIIEKSSNDLKEEHPEIVAWLEKNDPTIGQQAALFLGEGGRAILSPTTLFVVGKGLWGSLATGWGLGTQFSAADQFKEKGDVDIVDAATSPEGALLREHFMVLQKFHLLQEKLLKK